MPANTFIFLKLDWCGRFTMRHPFWNGFPAADRPFIAYIRSALVQYVKDDNVVYHGLAGHLLLKGIPHVLKVRVIADLADRVQAEMEREKISKTEARTLLLKDDEERRKWTQTLYGVDPRDSSLYDLVVHIHKLTIADAVDIICDTAIREPFKTTKQAQQKIEDYAMASEMKAGLSDSLTISASKANMATSWCMPRETITIFKESEKRPGKLRGRWRGSTIWRFTPPRNCPRNPCNHPNAMKPEEHFFTMRIRSCLLS